MFFHHIIKNPIVEDFGYDALISIHACLHQDEFNNVIAQNYMVSNGTYSPPMIGQENKIGKSSCYQHGHLIIGEMSFA